MNFNRNVSITFILFFLIILSSGCATILGQKNTLVFTSENGTRAKVFVDGEKIGEAPGKIKVSSHKLQHGSTLTLKAEGFSSTNFLVVRKQHGIYTVADLLMGGIPLLIDYSTGNIYQPSPRKFKYDLEENR